MRKIRIVGSLLVLAMLIALMAAAAYARNPRTFSEDLVLKNIMLGDYGSYEIGKTNINMVTIVNEGPNNLEDIKLEIEVLGTDVKAQSYVSIKDRSDNRRHNYETELLFMDVPLMKPGSYWVKISLEKNDLKRVRYREVEIKQPLC